MAIFHMTAKVCKTSATAKIDYIQRQNKYSYSTKAEDLIFSSEKNIPAWAKNAPDFFAEMDKQELSEVVKKTIAGNEKQLKELERLKDELLADISQGRDILKKLGLE